jgi:alpha-1,3-rhamnosyl/mannosyltransferase
LKAQTSNLESQTLNYAIDGRYIQDHFPGIGRYTYNLIDALARSAPTDRFVVLCNPSLRNSRYDLAALARHPNLELVRVNAPTFSLREQFELLTLNVELVHSPYYLKPYLLRLPSVVTLFDVIPLVIPHAVSWRARWFFRWAAWLAAKTSARVIVPSHATRDDLIAHLHLPYEKIAVIPLAPDSRFAPPTHSAIEAMRQKYNLPGDYVLYLGSNKPHKHLPLLVRAFAQSSIAHQTTLVIAGQWDVRYPDARNIAAETSARILFLDAVADADLPALYGGATLFVFPSQYEGFGLPPLEAMACGAPVACSNIPSLREVVDDAGVFFDLNVNAVQTTLEHLLNDPILRERLRERGLARAAQFSWEQTARATLQIYRTIIGEG